MENQLPENLKRILDARRAHNIAELLQVERERARVSARARDDYSLATALIALASGDHSLAPVEFGVSREIGEKRAIRGLTTNSIVVPTQKLIGARDLSASSAPGGGYLVETENGPVAEFLRKRSILGRFGATIIPDLRGDLALPKVTSGATNTWLSTETTQAAESQPVFGQIALSPKTVSTFVEISGQLLKQSNAEQVVRNILSNSLADAVDAAGLTGTGALGLPTGLLNVAGVNAITGTSLSWSGVLDFIVNTGTNNLDVSGWAMTPVIYKLLASREKAAGSGMILTDGAIDGRPAAHSMSVPTATLIAGPWAELWIGEWGTVDLSVDPYSKFTSRVVGVRAMFTLDIAVRYPAAFSAAASIT